MTELSMINRQPSSSEVPGSNVGLDLSAKTLGGA